MTLQELENELREYYPNTEVIIRDRITGTSFEIKEVNLELSNSEEQIVIKVQ